MKPRRGSAPKIVALFVYIIVILVAAPQAQQPASFTGSPGSMTAGPAAATPEATDIDLLVGRSTILNVGAPITRVSLTVPDVADAMVTAPQQLLIHGKTPGTISLFVWDRSGAIKTYEVNVRRDLKQLAEQVQQLFPGETISVAGSGKDVVLSGTVSTKYVIDKAGEVAGGFVEKKENVVNLLKQQEGVASNQVMLRVRFAEVIRSALQELGASYVANGYKNDWFGRVTSQQFAAPDFDSDHAGGLTFSDFLNIFVFNTKHNVGAVVRALQTKGLFQSLAEPNLIATNGKEASFLAGGEYPYPVAQNSSGGTSITIQFKEFGVRLTFTPTVLSGDLINLKVKPEVSALDFANGVNISGFRVPALSTRRTETEVELQDGQTFAVAGLMNNTVTSTMSKIPGIGDVPVLGYLFRSRAYQKQQTELVVMITPTIVRRGAAGVSQGLPTAVEPYLGAPSKPLPQPSAYTGSPRYPASGQSQPRTANDAPAASTPAATAPSSTATVPAPRPSAATAPAVPAPRPSAPVTATPANPAPAPAQTPQQPPQQAPRVPAATPQSMSQAPSTTAPSVSQAPSAAAPSVSQAPAANQPSGVQAVEVKAHPVERKAPVVDRKALEAERRRADDAAKAKAELDRKNLEAKRIADKRAADEKAVADKKAVEQHARQQKLDEERAKRESIVAKRNAEADRKKQDEQKKREKSLAEAAERLRQAQAAYQAEMEKTGSSKGNANDKPKGGVQ